MDLTQVLTGLESAKLAYDALVKEAVEPLKDALVATVKELGIKEINWAQYTPHWNDGEACEFGIHTPNIIIDNEGEDELETYECEWNDSKSSYFAQYVLPELKKHNITRTQWEKVTEFSNWITSYEAEDVMQAAFGDGYKVRVRPNGIVVDEYDHD